MRLLPQKAVSVFTEAVFFISENLPTITSSCLGISLYLHSINRCHDRTRGYRNADMSVIITTWYRCTFLPKTKSALYPK
ncbi:hypothetical protein Dda3937_04373 [Dickeya dadantii 3937]|uniref:Uncharacterized protein n=1 Tax=Dickeya dadantii (strain 3937) TaxID=198628 RepID=E0SN29_DICD3|nr:hypothetical protein Dda3937_04373 [Dickeya dadantii 3937]